MRQVGVYSLGCFVLYLFGFFNLLLRFLIYRNVLTNYLPIIGTVVNKNL